MSLLVYLGLLSASCAWLYLLTIFQDAAPQTGVALAVAGGASILLAVRIARGGWSACARALPLVAGIFAVQLATLPIAARLGARVHAVEFVARPTAWLLRACGVNCHAEAGVLYVPAAEQLMPISVTWEKLGLLPALWLTLATCLCYFGLARSKPLRSILVATAVLGIYLILRFALLVVLAAEHPEPLRPGASLIPLPIAWFRDPLLQIASFLPFAAILAALLPWRREELEPARVGRHGVLAGACAVLAGAVFAFGANYQDPGARKSGRVLLDEIHSADWERASQPFDRTWFGRSSVYNYATYYRWLNEHYTTTIQLDRRYSDEVLADTDVLILKTPTVPFETAEIDAIERFVERGGGLLLLGDHTDLLGMSSNLNAVAERFQIRFRLDGCNQLDDGQFHSYSPSIWNSHPASLAWDRLEFMTSCTLEAPLWSEDVMVAGNTYSDPVDYSAPSFFGNMIPDVQDSFGYHLLAVARKHGRGRVLAFSDSTILSTFGVMYDDRPDFVLASVEYLNRTNTTGYAYNQRALWAGAILAVLSVVGACAGRERRGVLTQVSPIAIVAGAWIGALSAHELAARAYPLPTPRGSTPEIAFVRELCNFQIAPALGGGRPNALDTFDTFYVWTQRLDAFPRIRNFDEALHAKAVVLIRPVAELGPTRLRQLERYVYGGGRLLVLDSIWNSSSSVNEILNPFGMFVSGAMRLDASTKGASESGGDTTECNWTSPALRLTGGTPLIQSADQRTLLAGVEYGRGRVLAAVDCAQFSTVGMGEQVDELEANDHRHELFALEFEIFDRLLRDSPDTARTAMRD